MTLFGVDAAYHCFQERHNLILNRVFFDPSRFKNFCYDMIFTRNPRFCTTSVLVATLTWNQFVAHFRHLEPLLSFCTKKANIITTPSFGMVIISSVYYFFTGFSETRTDLMLCASNDTGIFSFYRKGENDSSLITVDTSGRGWLWKTLGTMNRYWSYSHRWWEAVYGLALLTDHYCPSWIVFPAEWLI